MTTRRDESLASPTESPPSVDHPTAEQWETLPVLSQDNEEERPLLKRFLSSKNGRLAIIAALGLLIFGILILRGRKSASPDDSDPHHTLTPKAGFEETLTTAGELKSLYRSYGDRLESTEKGVQDLRKNVEGLEEDLEGVRSVLKTLLRAQENRESKLNRIMDTLRGALGPGSKDSGPTSKKKPGQSAERINVLSFESPLDKKGPARLLTIPAASAGEATVLNGVFAPVSGEPSPVRLRLDAAILGPNLSRVPIRNAYLIGMAKGDANSSRVLVEVIKLSYVTEDGEAISVDVQGYIEGGDGFEGMAGTYHYRAAEALPIVGLTGGLSGASDALSQRETTRSLNVLGAVTETVTGDPLRFAGLKALSGTSKKFEEIMAERLREIRPAVFTEHNQRVKVVFLSEFVIQGVDASEVDHEIERNPYAGLDLHR